MVSPSREGGLKVGIRQMVDDGGNTVPTAIPVSRRRIVLELLSLVSTDVLVLFGLLGFMDGWDTASAGGGRTRARFPCPLSSTVPLVSAEPENFLILTNQWRRIGFNSYSDEILKPREARFLCQPQVANPAFLNTEILDNDGSTRVSHRPSPFTCILRCRYLPATPCLV